MRVPRCSAARSAWPLTTANAGLHCALKTLVPPFTLGIRHTVQGLKRLRFLALCFVRPDSNVPSKNRDSTTGHFGDRELRRIFHICCCDLHSKSNDVVSGVYVSSDCTARFSPFNAAAWTSVTLVVHLCAPQGSTGDNFFPVARCGHKRGRNSAVQAHVASINPGQGERERESCRHHVCSC